MNRPPDPAVEAAAAGRVVAEGARHRSSKRHGGPQQARAPPKRGKKKRRLRTPQERVPPGTEIAAYTIPTFCAAHGGMSEAFFWKLVTAKGGPQLMKVGARTMVSAEAAAAWRREREAAAA
jgi:hypothetical protein